MVYSFLFTVNAGTTTLIFVEKIHRFVVTEFLKQSDDFDIHEVVIAFLSTPILKNLRMKEQKLSRQMITKSGNRVLKKISANHMNQN